MEIIQQIYPLEMTSTGYTRLYIFSEQCLQYTEKSSRKRLQPLGKKKNRCRVCIYCALHVEPFNTATKLYTLKKHTFSLRQDESTLHTFNASRMVFTATKKHKNRRLANSIPANNTKLGCKMNTCSDRRGSSCVWGTRFSMLDWVRVAGLSCTKEVWYIYDCDTG